MVFTRAPTGQRARQPSTRYMRSQHTRPTKNMIALDVKDNTAKAHRPAGYFTSIFTRTITAGVSVRECLGPDLGCGPG
eukprot:15067491-Alexandrium_andersonii.AAC.1